MRFLVLLAVLTLVAVAAGCSGATATPTPTPTRPAPTPTPTVAAPTATPTRAAATPTATPTIVVATPTPTTASAPTATPTASARLPRGTVTVAMNSFNLEVVDQGLGDSQTLSNYSAPLYDFFIRAEPSGALTNKNGLLESWSMNATGDVYTLKLKPGIKWHDGTELTSADIAFTLARYTAADARCIQCSALKTMMGTMETPDQSTAIVRLKSPNVAFLPALGSLEGDLIMLPKAAYEKVGKDGFANSPVGTGPYKFVGRKQGEYIEFDANTGYWNKERIPGFARLKFVLISASSAREAALQTGGADVAVLDASSVPTMKKAGITVGAAKGGGLTMGMFYGSYRTDMLTNKLEFRKALNLALDRKAIEAAFYPPEIGSVFRGNPPWCPGAVGYDPALTEYPYDPEQAKALLKQVGYAGEEITLWSAQQSINPEQAEVDPAIISDWQKVGIKVKYQRVDFSVLAAKRNASPQNYAPPAEMGVQGGFCRPSVLPGLSVYMLNRADGGVVNVYWNPEKMLKYYNEVKTIVDPQVRDTRMREINRELYNEYWVFPLVTRNIPIGFGPKVAANEYTPTQGTYIDLAWDTLRPR